MSENTNNAAVGTQFEEGALKVKKLTPMEVVWAVVGCGIGSGSCAEASRFLRLWSPP